MVISMSWSYSVPRISTPSRRVTIQQTCRSVTAPSRKPAGMVSISRLPPRTMRISCSAKITLSMR